MPELNWTWIIVAFVGSLPAMIAACATFVIGLRNGRLLNGHIKHVEGLAQEKGEQIGEERGEARGEVIGEARGRGQERHRAETRQHQKVKAKPWKRK